MGRRHLLHLDGTGLALPRPSPLSSDQWRTNGSIIDLCARRVIGWATSDRLKRSLAVEALRRAIANRNPSPGLVHHSHRGSQYCSIDYQAELRKRGLQISLSAMDEWQGELLRVQADPRQRIE